LSTEVTGGRGVKVREIAVLLHIVVKLIRDKTVVVSHVEVGRGAIIFPVGNTIADEHSLEFGNPFTGRFGSIDEHVKSQGELRHIDAGIRLSSDPEGIVLQGGKLCGQKLKNSLEVVVGRVVVVPLTLAQISANRETDISRALNVEHVGIVVPRPVIESEVVGTVFH
jgi:hypothetical protein